MINPSKYNLNENKLIQSFAIKHKSINPNPKTLCHIPSKFTLSVTTRIRDLSL